MIMRARKVSNITTWAGRKKKAVHKTTSTDDKRLQNTLKRLGVNTIPGIEEVNIFLESDLINFTNPKGAHARRCRAERGCAQRRYIKHASWPWPRLHAGDRLDICKLQHFFPLMCARQQHNFRGVRVRSPWLFRTPDVTPGTSRQ